MQLPSCSVVAQHGHLAAYGSVSTTVQPLVAIPLSQSATAPGDLSSRSKSIYIAITEQSSHSTLVVVFPPLQASSAFPGIADYLHIVSMCPFVEDMLDPIILSAIADKEQMGD